MSLRPLRSAWRVSPRAGMLVLGAAASVFVQLAPATEITLGPPPWELRPNVRWSLETIASMYEAARPDVPVTVTSGLPGFDASTVGPDDLGDVMFIPISEYGQPSILGTLVGRGLCVDLSDRTLEGRFERADFYPNTWESVTADGRTWGIPLMVRSWGIGVDTRKADAETLRQLARSWPAFIDAQPGYLQDYDGDGIQDGSVIRCGMSPYTIWSSLFVELGGNPSDPDSFVPGSPAWDGAIAKLRALRVANPYFFDMGRAPLAVDVRHDSAVMFVHDDEGGRTSFRRRDANEDAWRLIPLPGTGSTAPLNATVLAIKTSTMERESAAWEFVVWLTSTPVLAELAPRFHLTPVRRSVRDILYNSTTSFFASQLERIRFQKPLTTPNPAAVRLRQELNAEGTNTVLTKD